MSNTLSYRVVAKTLVSIRVAFEIILLILLEYFVIRKVIFKKCKKYT